MSSRTSPYALLTQLEHLEPYLAASLADLQALASRLAAGRGIQHRDVEVAGKTRHLTVPIDEALKNVHRRILSMLTAISIELPDHVTGYVRGRSILQNASAHAGNDYLQKFDFVDFFAHVSADSVQRGLQQNGFHEAPSRLIAALTTVDGSIPLGFSTSPALANMASTDLDSDLIKIASANGLAITRYADDLSFSGPVPFDIRHEVDSIARAHGHELNNRKTRTLKYGQPLYVTGLSVSDTLPRLPRPFKRRLRQELYLIQQFGLDEHARYLDEKPTLVRLRLGGQLAYAGSIEPDWTDALRKKFPSSTEQVDRAQQPESRSKRVARLQELAVRVLANEAGPPPTYSPSSTYAHITD